VFTLTFVYTPFLHRYSAPPHRLPANSCWWSRSRFIVWGRRITAVTKMRRTPARHPRAQPHPIAWTEATSRRTVTRSGDLRPWHRACRCARLASVALSQVYAGTRVLDRRDVNLCVPQSACPRVATAAARQRIGDWTMRTAMSDNDTGRVRYRVTCGSSRPLDALREDRS
jgi:hypothetical protein